MIKRIFKILAIILGFIIVAFIGMAYYMLSEIFDDLCGNSIFKEYYSPNQNKKAVVYERDCGATTTWSTHISILDYDEQLDNYSNSIFSIKGRPSDVAPNITWIDNKNIIIHHTIDGKEFRVENKFGLLNPIKIIYKQL